MTRWDIARLVVLSAVAGWHVVAALRFVARHLVIGWQ